MTKGELVAAVQKGCDLSKRVVQRIIDLTAAPLERQGNLEVKLNPFQFD